MVTFGSVPYASFSNQQVKLKVTEGYRLMQPYNCPDEFYSLMLHCWMPRPKDRPHFENVIRNHLEPARVKVGEGQLVRQRSTGGSNDASAER